MKIIIILLTVILPGFSTLSGDDNTRKKLSMEFSTLQEAIGFVVHCVENDKPDLLIKGMKYKRKVQPKMERQKSIFNNLKTQHKKKPYQELIKGKSFPKDQAVYKVGGHGKEYGHIHINFEKIGKAWYLKSVWVCR